VLLAAGLLGPAFKGRRGPTIQVLEVGENVPQRNLVHFGLVAVGDEQIEAEQLLHDLVLLVGRQFVQARDEPSIGDARHVIPETFRAMVPPDGYQTQPIATRRTELLEDRLVQRRDFVHELGLIFAPLMVLTMWKRNVDNVMLLAIPLVQVVPGVHVVFEGQDHMAREVRVPIDAHVPVELGGGG